ncbi:hypothetical protein BDW02DRAFT_603878 [Decorospora gaudefroyi]|uniref:Uncharacterized protein n=1 Tax=Decorospora gaudefroyi TaxID=184978 RepID=A0A6A5K0U7_9PLEO|nr:hypothetical protein BDW02DRAFT_603880 [Decorospora gaudefroyi]KAF1828024.1 hypothetical protein BDW02DRAFT_603878 [Decorospora gaudefroyi]
MAGDDFVNPIPKPPPIPSYVSNAPIPDHVYAFAPHNEPQPPLARWLCQGCIKSLTTPSKGEIMSNRTVLGVAVAFTSPEFCSRKNNFGVCSSCREAKTGGCATVSPEFRRAVNILVWLATYAHGKTLQAMSDPAAPGSLEELLSSEVGQPVFGHWDNVFNYAKLLREAFVDYPKSVARGRGGQSVEAYQQQRVASKEHNLKRYKLGLGSQGLNLPANVSVNTALERNFEKGGSARNREKRFYFYGPDIPAADEVTAPYQTPSPTKRAFAGTSSGRNQRKAGGRYDRDMEIDDQEDYRPSQSPSQRAASGGTQQ